MILIILIAGLCLLKFLEVGFVANLSWWWIILLMVIAFVWFEFVERIFGLDKRKAHEALDKARAERVKKTFDKK
ncbi:MAG: hypothetical protein K0S28_1242 [Paucimonas sp.]|jgi:small Trp-rich protein|nr:hypothetical protein [Paucimonas sp.]